MNEVRSQPAALNALLSSASVWPAYALRRAGLLDAQGEGLTHYHE